MIYLISTEKGPQIGGLERMSFTFIDDYIHNIDNRFLKIKIEENSFILYSNCSRSLETYDYTDNTSTNDAETLEELPVYTGNTFISNSLISENFQIVDITKLDNFLSEHYILRFPHNNCIVIVNIEKWNSMTIFEQFQLYVNHNPNLFFSEGSKRIKNDEMKTISDESVILDMLSKSEYFLFGLQRNNGITGTLEVVLA